MIPPVRAVDRTVAGSGRPCRSATAAGCSAQVRAAAFPKPLQRETIQPVEECLQELRAAASAVPHADRVSQYTLERETAAIAALPLATSPVVAQAALRRWKRITPTTLREMECVPTTSKDIASSLGERWVQRLALGLWPHRHYFLVWEELKKSTQAQLHFLDLFRATRWSTLRARMLDWENIPKPGGHRSQWNLPA